MENPIVPYSSLPVSRALVVAGLWIRLSIASLMLASGALAGLLQGAVGIPPALVAIAGGMAAAVLSWRRAIIALDRADTESETRSALAPMHA